MAANSETQPVSFASEFFLHVFQISHAKLFNYEIERQRGGGNGGTTGSNLSFFFHHLFRPSSRRVYPLPFFRLIQMSARRSRINATRYARNHSNDPWIFIAPQPTTPFVLFPTRARAYACVCVCGLSAMRPNVQLCDTLRQRLPPLMLTFVNRVFFVQWIRV